MSYYVYFVRMFLELILLLRYSEDAVKYERPSLLRRDDETRVPYGHVT